VPATAFLAPTLRAEGKRMKIFISWSGEASEEVARALKDWLPNVFQAIQSSDIFLSSTDIPVGSQWFMELGKVLDTCEFGILCLTRGNLAAPWILYEAGAVSKRFESARVAPLLIGLTNKDLASPLSHFNTASADIDGIRRLASAINDQLAARLTPSKLDNALKAFWPELEPALKRALDMVSRARSYRHDVFLSTPMAGFSDDAQFQAGRADFQKIYDALTRDCGFQVYWAAVDIKTMADYQTMDVSAQEDFAALDSSRYFVMIYPKKMVTGTLFEAGYALARGLHSLYFVRDRDDLPFMMQELAGIAPVRIQTQDNWGTYEKLAKTLRKQQAEWFPA
jgi:hypothetical protein